jgi:DNA-directed RNA polymerase subunit RPC12/RpoP
MDKDKQNALVGLLSISAALEANSSYSNRKSRPSYTCQRCGKPFKTSYELKNHDWEEHLEERRKER